MFSLPKNIDARFTVSVLSYKYDLNVSISIADMLNFLSKTRQLSATEMQFLAKLGQSADMHQFINSVLLASLGFNVPPVQITSEIPAYPSSVPSSAPSSIYPSSSVPSSHLPSSCVPSSIYPSSSVPSSYLPSSCVPSSIYPSSSVPSSYLPSYLPSSSVPSYSDSPLPTYRPSFRPTIVIDNNNGQLSVSSPTIECSPGNITLFIVAGIIVGMAFSQILTTLRYFYNQRQTRLIEHSPLYS